MKASKSVILSAAAAAALFTAAAIPAQAADIIETPPAPPPAAPVVSTPALGWEGGYAGVALGYGFSGKTETDAGDIDTDGFVGNGFAGYNWQSGSFVYGLEGDVGYNGMEGDDNGVEMKSGVDGTLRARLGYAATDSLLIYGTAGGAAEHLEITDDAGSDSNTMLGWTAGAGVDAKLTDNVFGRLEYRYTKFSEDDFNTGSGSQEVGDSSNKVLVGLGVKF